jgi:hypothetical protein
MFSKIFFKINRIFSLSILVQFWYKPSNLVFWTNKYWCLVFTNLFKFDCVGIRSWNQLHVLLSKMCTVPQGNNSLPLSGFEPTRPVILRSLVRRFNLSAMTSLLVFNEDTQLRTQAKNGCLVIVYINCQKFWFETNEIIKYVIKLACIW